jgi:hypothetical protein
MVEFVESWVYLSLPLHGMIWRYEKMKTTLTFFFSRAKMFFKATTFARMPTFEWTTTFERTTTQGRGSAQGTIPTAAWFVFAGRRYDYRIPTFFLPTRCQVMDGDGDKDIRRRMRMNDCINISVADVWEFCKGFGCGDALDLKRRMYGELVGTGRWGHIGCG